MLLPTLTGYKKEPKKSSTPAEEDAVVGTGGREGVAAGEVGGRPGPRPR